MIPDITSKKLIQQIDVPHICRRRYIGLPIVVVNDDWDKLQLLGYWMPAGGAFPCNLELGRLSKGRNHVLSQYIKLRGHFATKDKVAKGSQ